MRRLLSDDILQVKSFSSANLFMSIYGITVLYLKSLKCQLWISRSQIPFYWRRDPEPVKQIFATVKSTIDTYNSSNTVLLFLFWWNSPNVYTLVWKHTNKWPNICTFQIPSAKTKIVRQIHNWHRQLFKCSQCII